MEPTLYINSRPLSNEHEDLNTNETTTHDAQLTESEITALKRRRQNAQRRARATAAAAISCRLTR